MARHRQRTLGWLMACLGCLALGYMGSFTVSLLSSSPSLRTWSPPPRVYQTLREIAPPLRMHKRRRHRTDASNSSSSISASGSTDEEVSIDNLYAKGVIMSLHNDIVAMGVSLIRELRCLGNDEVIQVYHCFPDEMSSESKALLTGVDPMVEVIDVCTELLENKEARWFHEAVAPSFKSYWLKPLALYHTKIREVILLDADAVLMRDPADLRDLSGYNRTGTTFFYDRVTRIRKFLNGRVYDRQMLHHLIENYDYERFELTGPKPSDQLKESLAYKGVTGHEMDSSLVLIDKTRAGKALGVLRDLIMRLRTKLKFSWGDKESFWLAYELAQQDYFFSPYGLSLIDSVPNGDMSQHPDTLCGSMAHFFPTENPDDVPELLYVNGKALLDPFPQGVAKTLKGEKSRMFNINPTHVTPRYVRNDIDLDNLGSFECMDKMGAVPIPRYFYERLMRRRMHFFAVETKFYDPLARCEQSVE